MATAQVIQLVQGDTRPTISLELFDKNDNDSPLNISGATVRMYIRVLDVPGITDTLIGTVMDGLNGKVSFEFNSNTLEMDGEFEAEVEVVYGSGATHTAFDKLYLVVREEH